MFGFSIIKGSFSLTFEQGAPILIWPEVLQPILDVTQPVSGRIGI